MKLPPQLYYEKVKLSTLISFDLIIFNKENKILLGKRKNNPAKGLWFIPGGTIYKDEQFDEAIKRISKDELGLEIPSKDFKFVGIYNHIYKENFIDSKFSTHYVCIALKHLLKDENKINKGVFLEQHDDFIWMKKEELINNSQVHQNTKNYFIKNPDNKLTL